LYPRKYQTFQTVAIKALASEEKNSADSSKWATKNLREWLKDYNSRIQRNSVQTKSYFLLVSKNCLTNDCVYVTETRKENGDPFERFLGCNSVAFFWPEEQHHQ
jgi:hypothetical protein